LSPGRCTNRENFGTALDAITAFAVPNPNCSSQSQSVFSGLVALQVALPSRSLSLLRTGKFYLCVHRPLSGAASSSPKLAPLQSLPSQIRSAPLSRGAPSLGLANSPHRGTNQQRVLRRASQTRRLAVLGVSHALDGLLRHRPCGFISPHNHVQGFSLQGFSRPHSRNASSASDALASLAATRCPHIAA